MISVLICGYNPVHETHIKHNIETTIGYPYELIYYNNIYKKGLCEVYNQLARQANGEILCFIHEDIEILTPNWGMLLKEAHQSYELVGVAGGKYKTRTPSVWSTTGYYCLNLIQHYKYTQNKPPQSFVKEHILNSKTEDAVCLDGIFISTRKEVFEKISFDDKSFKGFHGYDYDFCINASQYFKLGIAKKIQLAHFSEGENSKDWIDAQVVLYHKWNHYLPISTKDINFKNKKYFEFLAYKQCIYKMNKYKYYRWDVLLKLFKIKYMYYALVYMLSKETIQKP